MEINEVSLLSRPEVPEGAKLVHKRCLERVGGKVLHRGWDLSTTEGKKIFITNIITFLFYVSLTGWLLSGQPRLILVELVYRITGNVDISLIMEILIILIIGLYFLFFIIPGFLLSGPFFLDFFRQALIMEKGIALHSYNPFSRMYWFYPYENIAVFYFVRRISGILFGKYEFMIYVKFGDDMVSGIDSITSRNFYNYEILFDIFKKNVKNLYNGRQFKELWDEYHRERVLKYLKMKKNEEKITSLRCHHRGMPR